MAKNWKCPKCGGNNLHDPDCPDFEDYPKKPKVPIIPTITPQQQAQQEAVNKIKQLLDENGLTIFVEQIVRIVPKK